MVLLDFNDTASLVNLFIRKSGVSLLILFVSAFTLNAQNQPRPYWTDMTTTEFANLDAERVIAILPVAAIEQHGPHLPVCADACANKAVIDLVINQLPKALPVTVLPMMPIGKSSEHSSFPGTLTLEPETLRHLWTEIAESVYRAGIRKLVFYNSHGGQPQVMDIVARDLRVRLGMLVVTVNQYSLYRTDLFPEDELRYGVHGGSMETSVMLYVRPDLVDMEKAENFSSLDAELDSSFQYLSITGPTRIAWKSQDLNPAGVVGNALDADPERGALLIEGAAAQLLLILKEIDRYPMENIRRGPLDIDNDNK